MLRHRVQGDGTCESLEAVEAAAANDAHLDWGGARHGDDGVWRLSQLILLYKMF